MRTRGEGKKTKKNHMIIEEYITSQKYITSKMHNGQIGYFLTKNDKDIANEINALYGTNFSRNNLVYWRRKHGIGPAGINWGGDRKYTTSIPVAMDDIIVDFASGYDAVELLHSIAVWQLNMDRTYSARVELGPEALEYPGEEYETGKTNKGGKTNNIKAGRFFAS